MRVRKEGLGVGHEIRATNDRDSFAAIPIDRLVVLEDRGEAIGVEPGVGSCVPDEALELSALVGQQPMADQCWLSIDKSKNRC